MVFTIFFFFIKVMIARVFFLKKRIKNKTGMTETTGTVRPFLNSITAVITCFIKESQMKLELSGSFSMQNVTSDTSSYFFTLIIYGFLCSSHSEINIILATSFCLHWINRFKMIILKASLKTLTYFQCFERFFF